MPKLLVIADTDGSRILPATLSAVAFAQRWSNLTSGEFDILLLGEPQIAADSASLAAYGAGRIWIMASAALRHPLADVAGLAVHAAAKAAAADSLAGASTQFGRDVLPRAAGLTDLPMLSDVLSLELSDGEMQFKRPMYAGSVIATVGIIGAGGVFSVRTTAFGKPITCPSDTIIDSIPFEPGPLRTKWLGLDAGEQTRPDLTSARVVVAGGRPLRDAETFERVLGGLADRLDGALGATRAAVDGGIASNELQVGQTGKIVAPDLYIAAGISGSIQHLAGMKDSKVIVAINTDSDAPIFDVADYGLVADLYQVIPEMTAKV